MPERHQGLTLSVRLYKQVSVELLPLTARVSTYKFSELIFIHSLRELVKRICYKIKAFSLK